MDVGAIGQDSVLRGHGIDVTRERERTRQRRLWKRVGLDAPGRGLPVLARRSPATRSSSVLPHLGPDAVADGSCRSSRSCSSVSCSSCRSSAAGRSPHVRYHASEIDVTFDDVVGLGPVKDEVVKTLNLFLALPDVPRRDGWQPAEGDPVRRPARNRQDLHGQGDGEGSRACRTSSSRPPRSSRCTTARPAARSATTSRRCARPRAKRAARSASSRRSTRSPARAAACSTSPAPVGVDGAVSYAIEPSGVERGHLRRRQRAAHPVAVVRPADVRPAASAARSSTSRTGGCRYRRIRPEAAARAVEHLADRRDQPRRRPRPRAAAPGPLRPVDPLRPAEPLRPPRDRRLLPRRRRRTFPSSTRKSAATSSPR